MMENRSFDHLLGFLKRLNPNIDGLTGNESNPITPSDPNSPLVTVTDTAGYITSVDPGHSIGATETQLWGTGVAEEQVPSMDGFVYSYNSEGDTSDKGAAIMECFSPETVPAISTLATNFAIFDRWYASIPGPTQPNRMFLFSATSDGAASNDDLHIALGYPQKTVFDNLYENGHSFGVYFSDFPGALIMRTLREPKYWPYIKQVHRFYDDCAAGVLPSFSFLEPRWFTVGDWGASDEHPPHNVTLGEQFISDVYAAVRASPLWERTLLIITFDEHGGFYDHVPTPILNVPSPDGKVSENPPFNFERLGVRVPAVMCSPWISKGIIFNEPNADQVSGQVGSRFEHSSVSASLVSMFGLPSFLTNRDAWAAHFDTTIVTESQPRTDCPLTVPYPATPEEKAFRARTKHRDITDEEIAEYERLGKISTDPLTDLQYEFLNVAKGLTGDLSFDVRTLKTEHEGALYCRAQLRKFFNQ